MICQGLVRRQPRLWPDSGLRVGNLELELEPTPGLRPSPSVKAILLRQPLSESADETSRPGRHIPFSLATGQQPRIPRAANPRSEASRASTCSSAMQTTSMRHEEQEERELHGGRSGSLSKHTKQAQVRISYTISQRKSIRYRIIGISYAICHTISHAISHLNRYRMRYEPRRNEPT